MFFACFWLVVRVSLPKGTSVFSAVLAKVAAEGVGQTVLAALLLASGAQGLFVMMLCKICSIW
jgi:hypothetical protein